MTRRSGAAAVLAAAAVLLLTGCGPQAAGPDRAGQVRQDDGQVRQDDGQGPQMRQRLDAAESAAAAADTDAAQNG
ncbi:hypothetical protein [Kitasatospora sp. NBC_01539]|uniref:hypothetical protein n=1 Tax=Kitasatospora sp. NBC_01539 TaxID=2903577 RepID=UPI0038602A6F